MRKIIQRIIFGGKNEKKKKIGFRHFRLKPLLTNLSVAESQKSF
jgi:hypothetical protein